MKYALGLNWITKLLINLDTSQKAMSKFMEFETEIKESS